MYLKLQPFPPRLQTISLREETFLLRLVGGTQLSGFVRKVLIALS